MNPKTIGAAVLGVAIALGGAYEVAVEDAVEVVYLDKADQTQKVARCVGSVDKDGKAATVAKCLPASAVAISVSAPRAKLLATSKATLAPEEQDSPCACAPWTPAKEDVLCEVLVKSMDPKFEDKWIPAPTLTTLSAGSWRGGCVATGYGCTICQVRDLCPAGDPSCFMDARCRSPEMLKASADAKAAAVEAEQPAP